MFYLLYVFIYISKSYVLPGGPSLVLISRTEEQSQSVNPNGLDSKVDFNSQAMRSIRDYRSKQELLNCWNRKSYCLIETYRVLCNSVWWRQDSHYKSVSNQSHCHYHCITAEEIEAVRVQGTYPRTHKWRKGDLSQRSLLCRSWFSLYFIRLYR